MKRNSRLLIYMGCVALLSSLLISGISYGMLRQHIFSEASERSRLLLDFVNASSSFFEQSQKGLINELLEGKDGFYPELTNGFMLLREQSDRFKQLNHSHSFRLASLNPLNADNAADSEEAKIIKTFQSNQQMRIQKGLIRKNSDILFFTATPIRINSTSCLNCHGNPDIAPRAQTILYGKDSGYNWQVDQTITTALAYVSIKKSLDKARTSARKIFVLSLVCFLFSQGGILLFSDRN